MRDAAPRERVRVRGNDASTAIGCCQDSSVSRSVGAHRVHHAVRADRAICEAPHGARVVNIKTPLLYGGPLDSSLKMNAVGELMV